MTCPQWPRPQESALHGSVRSRLCAQEGLGTRQCPLKPSSQYDADVDADDDADDDDDAGVSVVL